MLFIIVLSSYFVSAVDDLIAFQGNVQQSGVNINDGNLSVVIFDAYTGGNIIYNSTTDFNGAINSGKYDVMLGNGSNDLSLEYGKLYYIEMFVNGEKFTFNGSTRQVFQSSIGQINNSYINNQNINSSHLAYSINITNATGYLSSNLVGNITFSQITGGENVVYSNDSATFAAGKNVTTQGGGWFKGMFNWIINAASVDYLSFNGTDLTVSDNITRWLYNQTTSANDYTDALNTSVTNRLTVYNNSASDFTLYVNSTAGAYTLYVNSTIAGLITAESTRLQTNITDLNTSVTNRLTVYNNSAGAYTLYVNSTIAGLITAESTRLQTNITDLNTSVTNRLTVYNNSAGSYTLYVNSTAGAYAEYLNSTSGSYVDTLAVKYADRNWNITSGDFNWNFTGGGALKLNSGWQGGGITLSGGDIFAQSIFVYNITSLGVSNLDINGSLLPHAGFNNTFDVGSSSLQWKDGYFGTELYINGVPVSAWITNTNTNITDLNTSVTNRLTVYNNSAGAYTLYVNSTAGTYANYVNSTAGSYTLYVNSTIAGLITAESTRLQTNITDLNTSVTNRLTVYNNSAGAYTLYVNSTAGAYANYVNSTAGAYTLYVNGTMANYVINQSKIFNNSMASYTLYVNGTMANYVINQSKIFNNSMASYVLYVNSTNGQGGSVNDGSINSSSWNRTAGNVYLRNGGDKVGIGTSTPGQTLTVVGNVNITGGLNVTNGLNVLTGNVGIGTTSPNAQLVIEDAQIILRLNSSNNVYILPSRKLITDRAEIVYQTDSVNKWLVGLTDSDTAGLDGDEYFIGVTSGGGGYALLIETNGDIAIGGDLDVVGGNITTGTLRFGTTTSTGGWEFEDGGVCIGDGGCTAPTTDGRLFVFNTINVGDTTPDNVNYSKFGSGGTPNAAITANNDVLITGDLDVDGTAYYSSTTWTVGDIAENIHTKSSRENLVCNGNVECLKQNTRDNLDFGDLVCIDTSEAHTISKCNEANSHLAVGFVTESARIFVGPDEGYPISLAGIVNARVTNENGNIVPGDLLVSASKPGYAMKSESPKDGTVVGKAFDFCDEEECKIPVFVALS